MKKVVIVGGVAGGASAAARIRRQCEDCEILIFERGPYVSFANCGLPYYVGEVIENEDDLLVATPELFAERFSIEVRTQSEVFSIDREAKTLEVKNLQTGEVYAQAYDALVLSPGAKPIRPPLPGIDHAKVFSLRTIPDSRRIKEAADGARRAVIVGAGFIGLEMAENLKGLGLQVTLIELADQVMPPFDPEIAILIQHRLEEHGIEVLTGVSAQAFTELPSGELEVGLSNEATRIADFVILAIGVRPEANLAEAAGLKLGKRGGIAVDSYMRTSDAHIWAVGDAVEVKDLLTDNWTLIPLAGPANRQGRIAADNIVGRDGNHQVSTFRGVQGTAIAGVFGLAAAATGASAKTLQRAGINDVGIVYLHPDNHVGYYPGASPITLKLLYSTTDGRIYGVQAVGEQGVARRIDVISMAMQKNGTVYDLEEAELAYAPQFGAAKDPVNMAGMIAANQLRGDLPLASWNEVNDKDTLLIDVRSVEEFEEEHIGHAKNIPVDELRDRLPEIPREKAIWLTCEVGKRAYYATRLLLQRGYDARNLSGGMMTYKAFRAAGLLKANSTLGDVG